MQSNLDEDGKLRPPTSIRQARERLQLLSHEITSIDRQLADREWTHATGNSSGLANHASWRARAETKLSLFLSERRQLQEWLDAAESPLFRASYDLLKTLQREDCDFDPPEVELINKLDKHFKE